MFFEGLNDSLKPRPVGAALRGLHVNLRIATAAKVGARVLRDSGDGDGIARVSVGRGHRG